MRLRLAPLVLILTPVLEASSLRAEEPLFVYCCAGFRPPIEEVATAFQAEHGIDIDLTYAGSGCLIGQAELSGRGDLFVPGEEHYMAKARERSLIIDSSPVAYLRPVIAVRKGNPREIEGLADLAASGLRLGLGDPTSVAVGIATESWFAAELDPATISSIGQNVITRAINVNELGNQLALGGLDAAIVWDVTVPLFDNLEAIVPESSVEHRTVITAGILKMSRRQAEAARFLAFLTGPRGDEILARHGYEAFEPIDSDKASASPNPHGSNEQTESARLRRDVDGESAQAQRNDPPTESLR